MHCVWDGVFYAAVTFMSVMHSALAFTRANRTDASAKHLIMRNCKLLSLPLSCTGCKFYSLDDDVNWSIDDLAGKDSWFTMNILQTSESVFSENWSSHQCSERLSRTWSEAELWFPSKHLILKSITRIIYKLFSRIGKKMHNLIEESVNWTKNCTFYSKWLLKFPHITVEFLAKNK